MKQKVSLKEPSSRQQRRARQRAENAGRAEEMHKARLENPLITAEESLFPKYNIGCSGWFYWGWRDLFYPEGLPTHKWFPHYAKHFNTVELNAPFYSWPKVTTVKTWIRQAKEQPFLYTVKVSELITHVKRFTGTKTLIKDFGYIADLLGERMGCLLFQLPPSYHYTRARLTSIVNQLESHRRNVVEFRHASWWNETVYDALSDAGIIFCSCSGPRLPDTLVKTADDIYVRFHGTQHWYRHNYSKTELKDWANRIYDSGAKHSWVYFNNDVEAHAPENAKTLFKILKACE